jgi:hypothetical protein
VCRQPRHKGCERWRRIDGCPANRLAWAPLAGCPTRPHEPRRYTTPTAASPCATQGTTGPPHLQHTTVQTLLVFTSGPPAASSVVFTAQQAPGDQTSAGGPRATRSSSLPRCCQVCFDSPCWAQAWSSRASERVPQGHHRAHSAMDRARLKGHAQTSNRQADSSPSEQVHRSRKATPRSVTDRWSVGT